MSNIKIEFDTHGKANVRIVKVVREGEKHILKELTTELLLEGDFEKSYTEADNSSVVPTDTCKNILYAKAFNEDLTDIEKYALKVGKFVVDKYKHVTAANISVVEHLWERIEVKGKPHAHSFQRISPTVRTTKVKVFKKSPPIVTSAIQDLLVLKTTGSGFVKFHKCDYTVLPEVSDRIFSSVVSCSWEYFPQSLQSVNFTQVWEGSKTIVLETFADTYSHSVQDTNFRIGKQMLDKFPQIKNVKLQLPNKHHWVVDLEKFGIDNKNIIFVPVSAPNGDITVVLSRKTESKL